MAGQDIQKINVQITGNSGPFVKELEKAGNTANKVISQIKRESDAIARKGAAAGLADQVTLKQNLELMKLYGSDRILQDRISAQMRMIALQKQYNDLIKAGISAESMSKASSAMGGVKASKLAGGFPSAESLTAAEGVMGGLTGEAEAEAARRAGFDSWWKLQSQKQKALEETAAQEARAEAEATAARRAGYDSWWKLQEQKRRALQETADAEAKAEDEAAAKRRAGYDAWWKLQNQKQKALEEQQREEDDRIESTLQAQFSAGQKEERTSKYQFERNRRQLQALSGLIEEVGGDTSAAAIAMHKYAELVDQATATGQWSAMKEAIDEARDSVVSLIAEQSAVTGVNVGGEAGIAMQVKAAGGSAGFDKAGRNTQAAIQQLIFAADDAAVSFGTGGLAGAIRGASNNVTQFAQLMYPSSPWIFGLTVAGSAAVQLGLALWDNLIPAEEAATEETNRLAAAEDRLREARKQDLAIVQSLNDALEDVRGADGVRSALRQSESQLRGQVEASFDTETIRGRQIANRLDEIDQELETERNVIKRRRLREERAELEAERESRVGSLLGPGGRAGGAEGMSAAQSQALGEARQFAEQYARQAAAEPGTVLGEAVASANQALDAWERYQQSAEYAAADVEARNERFLSLFADTFTRMNTASRGQGAGTPYSGVGMVDIAGEAYRRRQEQAPGLAASGLGALELGDSIAEALGDNPAVQASIESIQEDIESLMSDFQAGLIEAGPAGEALAEFVDTLLTVEQNANAANEAAKKAAEQEDRLRKAREDAWAERDRTFDAFMANSDVGDELRQKLAIRDWMAGARQFGLSEDEAKRQAQERFGQRLDPLGQTELASKAAIGVESLRTSQELVRLLSGDDSSRRLVDINKKQLDEQRRTNELIEEQGAAAFAIAD